MHRKILRIKRSWRDTSVSGCNHLHAHGHERDMPDSWCSVLAQSAQQPVPKTIIAIDAILVWQTIKRCRIQTRQWVQSCGGVSSSHDRGNRRQHLVQEISWSIQSEYCQWYSYQKRVGYSSPAAIPHSEWHRLKKRWFLKHPNWF